MNATRVASRLLVVLGSREPSLSLDQAYDLWSATYPPRAHNPLMRAEQAAVAPILARLRPRRALDVGTGSGRYLGPLAATGARLVVGLDRSMGMLARQADTAPRVRADALGLPFGTACFDLVTASLVAGDVADLAAWTGEIARVLAPGGHLVYSDFHPSWTSRRWRRTFRTASGRSVEVPYLAHSIDEHLAALEGSGLRVVTVREPYVLEEDLREWPVRARLGGVRVAIVLHAVRVDDPHRYQAHEGGR
jgi:malonyl-CoA O-methyltransferase